MDPIALRTQHAEGDSAPLGMGELPRPEPLPWMDVAGVLRDPDKAVSSGRTAVMRQLACHRGARWLPRRAVAISSLEAESDSWRSADAGCPRWR